MHFYKTRRLRIVSVASLLLFLAGIPVLLSLTRPAAGAHADAPAAAVAYAHGLSSLSIAGIAALGLAIVFGVGVVANQRQEVNRKYLGKNARRHHGAIATLRTLATVLGGAGLIVGSLLGLHAGIIQARPDLQNVLALPFFTAELALISLLGGGALYAAGRLGR